MKTQTTWRTRIGNIRLKHKFYLILLFVVFSISIGAIVSYQFMLKNYNRMIYAKTAENLTALSSKINDNLQTIQDTSGLIAVSSGIQDHLSVINDPDSSRMDYLNSRQAVIRYFTANFSSNPYIMEISILAKDGTVITFGRDSSPESRSVQKTMNDVLRENQGGTSWISTGRSDSSILCIRAVRKVKNLSLKNIGLLAIRVDLEKMVSDARESMGESGDTELFIQVGSAAIYPVGSPSGKELGSLPPAEGPYQIVNFGGNRKFVVRSSLDNLHWTCISLTNYNQIFRSLVFSNILFIAIVVIIAFAAIFVSDYIVRKILRHINILIEKLNDFKNDSAPPKKAEYDYSNRMDELGAMHRGFDNMANRINQLIQENYVKQLLIKDTQLKILEQQINPHFLFNTLESINWMAKVKKENQISVMTESLGSMLRYTVNEKADVVPISKELDVVQSYMAIQQIRFDDRLRFTEEVDPSLLSVPVPKMCIQPLLENAIQYSVEKNVDGCSVDLSVFREGKTVAIRIQNEGSRIDTDILNKMETKKAGRKGSGIGLANINRRIQLIFGSQYGLFFQNRDNLAIVTIRVPFAADKGESECCG